MNTTEQSFFENQTRHFGVVFFFEVSDCGKNAVRFGRKPNVSAFKRLTHLNRIPVEPNPHRITGMNTLKGGGGDSSVRESWRNHLGGLAEYVRTKNFTRYSCELFDLRNMIYGDLTPLRRSSSAETEGAGELDDAAELLRGDIDNWVSFSHVGAGIARLHFARQVVLYPRALYRADN